MRSLPYALIMSFVVLSVHLLNSNPVTYAAENLDRFWSILTGDQQTPPVTTDAIGYVGLSPVGWLHVGVQSYKEGIGSLRV